MKKSGGRKYAIFNWSIPAYQSELDGVPIKTCPWAGDCAVGCYAQQKTYTWPVVKAAHSRNLQLALGPDFVRLMSDNIDTLLKRKTIADKQLVIRIHDSGDFFSRTYLNKWIAIMLAYPGVVFYAYTKAIKLHIIAGSLPPNYRWVQSEGGTQDHLIDYSKPHARVFASDAELALANYESAMDNDAIAFTSVTGRIGLVYHGAKTKLWSTTA